MHLEPVTSPLVGEEEKVVVRGGDEQVLHEILFLGAHAGNASSASPLPPVEADRNALGVAEAADGYHHEGSREAECLGQ